MDERQKTAWKEALRRKQAKGLSSDRANRATQSGAGIGPNKAAGRKGGIRRQGSKRG